MAARRRYRAAGRRQHEQPDRSSTASTGKASAGARPGQGCTGREGKSAILKMPLGTIFINEETGQTWPRSPRTPAGVLCKGGNGGWGNTRFKTSTTARRANPSRPARRARSVPPRAESIADVGLVGFPNAGKSTLTNAITAARPRVAAIPSPLLHPQIGVMIIRHRPAVDAGRRARLIEARARTSDSDTVSCATSSAAPCCSSWSIWQASMTAIAGRLQTLLSAQTLRPCPC